MTRTAAADTAPGEAGVRETVAVVVTPDRADEGMGQGALHVIGEPGHRAKPRSLTISQLELWVHDCSSVSDSAFSIAANA